MTYWSRSRQELWLKGLTSGHFQYVKSLALDCDNDTILAKVDQIGAACHTGQQKLFLQTSGSEGIQRHQSASCIPGCIWCHRRPQTSSEGRILHQLSLRQGHWQDPQKSWRRVHRDHHCCQEPGQRRNQIRDFWFSVPRYGPHGRKRCHLGRDHQRTCQKVGNCQWTISTIICSPIFRIFLSDTEECIFIWSS